MVWSAGGAGDRLRIQRPLPGPLHAARGRGNGPGGGLSFQPVTRRETAVGWRCGIARSECPRFFRPAVLRGLSRGDLFIGNIQDSGWLGGTNVGDLVRLRPNTHLSNGLQEIRATPHGFQLTFFQPVDRTAAESSSSYRLVGYTRVWHGGYATPDTGRHRVNIRKCTASPDGRTVVLFTDRLREGYVYEVSTAEIRGDSPANILAAHGLLHLAPHSEGGAGVGRVSAKPAWSERAPREVKVFSPAARRPSAGSGPNNCPRAAGTRQSAVPRTRA